MLTFTKALPLFAIVITLAYMALLLKSKSKSQVAYARPSSAILFISCFLASLGVALTLLTDFRESIPYYALLTAVVIGILVPSSRMSLRRESLPLLLYLIIMCHVMVLFDQIPEIKMSLHETDDMTAFMVSNGKWEFKASHNPSYNPFPTMTFIRVALSYVTSLTWYNLFLDFVFSIAIIVAYDLILFYVTSEVTESTTAGLLAILLLAFTPETNIRMHLFQWPGNLLVLISTLMFVRGITRRRSSRSGTICIVLSFTAAILTHATAGIGIFFPYVAIAIWYVVPHILRVKEAIFTIMPRIKRHILHIGILLLVIMLARAICVSGWSEYTIPILLDFFKNIFLPQGGERTWTPLYARSSINPIQAYVWALAIAAATAMILVEFYKKEIKFWHLTFFTLAIIFISLGYLRVFLGGSPASTAEYRGTYVAIPFMIPLAALACTKILKSGKKVTAVSLILLALAAPIAAHDPEISPREWARARGYGCRLLPGFMFPRLMPEDIIEGHTVAPLLSQGTEVAIKSEALKVGTSGRAGMWRPGYTNRLTEAVKLISRIHDLNLPDMTVVLSEEELLFDFNKVYDSSRSIIYCSA